MKQKKTLQFGYVLNVAIRYAYILTYMGFYKTLNFFRSIT